MIFLIQEVWLTKRSRLIPAFAISTNGADYLSENVTKYDNLELNLKFLCKSYPDKISHNVIGETGFRISR